MTSLPPPPKLHTPKATQTPVDAFFEYFGTDNVNDFITMEDADFKTSYYHAADKTKFLSYHQTLSKKCYAPCNSGMSLNHLPPCPPGIASQMILKHSAF
jgi:hypothetical protein